MKGKKLSLFHVYMYHVLLIAIGAPASRTVCSLDPAVCLVPVTHGIEVGVFAAPVLYQLEEGCFFLVSPVGYNLQNQYSFEEQIMQLQISTNRESH